MKKYLTIAIMATVLSGCAVTDTVKKYWPRAHDPVLFDHLVALSVGVETQNCESPAWNNIAPRAEQLAKYAEWRRDPQAENLRGLQKHIDRMSQGGSKGFCELGKKTARQRIEAARTALEGR